MKRLLLRMIGFYQRRISPAFGARCRFHPSCSSYAKEAIEVHGAFKGFFLTLWRLLRCQPLCKGGYDPVPLPKTSKPSES
ncbi:MAG: membrane protein insertion efficiency factor YidD [Planctomycetes bacterium]|nr:membrane protein insertion efficiency factor YidD [Planctomycetota bacterium]